jgi:hypothetical protein
MLRSVIALRGLGSVTLVALIATASGCYVINALSECPGETDPVEAGSTVSGVDPDAQLSALFKTTNGVLTWARTAESTPVHVTIARGRSAAMVQWDDCPTPAVVTGFSVPIYVQIRTDDGFVDTTASGTATEGSDGGIEGFSGILFPASDISSQALSYPSGDAGLGGSNGEVYMSLLLMADGGEGLQSGQLSEASGAAVATFTFSR